MKKVALAMALGVCAVASSAADDIRFYTTEYVGDDIAYENVGCGRPVIPQDSLTKDEIRKVADDVAAWRTCYNTYVEKLAALQPAGKALPPGLVAKMTPAELDLAKRRLVRVYEVVAEDAEGIARSVLAQNEAWLAKTNQNVALHEARQRDKLTQIERMKHTLDSPRLSGLAGPDGGRR